MHRWCAGNGPAEPWADSWLHRERGTETVVAMVVVRERQTEQLSECARERGRSWAATELAHDRPRERCATGSCARARLSAASRPSEPPRSFGWSRPWSQPRNVGAAATLGCPARRG